VGAWTEGRSGEGEVSAVGTGWTGGGLRWGVEEGGSVVERRSGETGELAEEFGCCSRCHCEMKIG
jgi:hypothetical protein